MKDYKELTTKELADLTEEQVEQYEKLLLCQNGIKILEKPEEPDKPIFEKDCDVYSITGLSISNLAFTDAKEALETVEFLKSKKTLGKLQYSSDIIVFKLGPDKDYNNNPLEIGLESKRVYSEENASDIKVILDDYKTAKAEYDEEYRVYCEVQEQVEKATEPFIKAHLEAIDIMNKRIKFTNLFYKDYLPLAGGDKIVAMNFLKKAYDISKEDEEYILNNNIKTE